MNRCFTWDSFWWF